MSLLMEYGNWKAKIFSFMVILRQGHAVDIYRFYEKSQSNNIGYE